MSTRFSLDRFLQQTRHYLERPASYLFSTFSSQTSATQEHTMNRQTHAQAQAQAQAQAIQPEQTNWECTDKELTVPAQDTSSSQPAAEKQQPAPQQPLAETCSQSSTRPTLSLSGQTASKAVEAEQETAEPDQKSAGQTPSAYTTEHCPAETVTDKTPADPAPSEACPEITAEKAEEKNQPEEAEPAVNDQPEAEPAPRYRLPDQQWQSCFEAVAGLAHRDANPPLPCQDSAMALSAPRPTVIVADGAGSSAVSEIGSQAVTSGLARLLNTLERQVAQLLDQPVQADGQQQHEQDARNFSLLLVKHAKGILDDLAALHRRPQKDFRCTLLLAIQGKAHLLWLKIGDGALITENLLENAEGQLTPQLNTLGQVGKGEFANATTFIDAHLQPGDVQSGLCSSTRITGFAAMSDGGADRLVSNDGSQVSGQISNWLHQLRQSQLKRRALTLMFSSDTFTRGTTGDDVSLALCASGLGETSGSETTDSDAH